MGISHRLMTSLLSSSGRCCWYCSSYGSVVQWSRCAHSSTARSTVTYGIPSDLERRRWSVWPMTSIGNNDRIRCDVKVHQSRRRNIFLQPSKEKYDDERTKEKFDELSVSICSTCSLCMVPEFCHTNDVVSIEICLIYI